MFSMDKIDSYMIKRAADIGFLLWLVISENLSKSASSVKSGNFESE